MNDSEMLLKFRAVVGLCASCKFWERWSDEVLDTLQSQDTGTCKRYESPYSNPIADRTCLYWEKR